MKKFFVILLVLVVMCMTMVSCVESNPEVTKDSYDIKIDYEDVIIDGFDAGSTANYGDYYIFDAHTKQGYMVFLDAMEEKIEIVDISIYYHRDFGTQYMVTYKLLDN